MLRNYYTSELLRGVLEIKEVKKTNEEKKVILE